MTPPTALSVCQPRSATSRSSAGPSSCGSRSSGWAPLRVSSTNRDRRRRPGTSPRSAGAEGRPGTKPSRRASVRALASASRAMSSPDRRGTGPAGSSGWSRWSRSSGWSVIGSPHPPDLGAHDVDPGAGQQLRHVAGHGGGHEHLLGAGDHRRQPAPAVVVELGEDVVEHQHRLAAGGSARSRSYDASRSASANDHDSPWLA